MYFMVRSHSVNMYVFAACFIFASHLVSLTDGKCGRINLSGRSGDLTSPSYPKPYPSHSQCSWLIKVPAGQYIKLQFLHFVLENSFGCRSDVLKAFDGPDTSATLLGKYCGPRTDFFNIISTSNTMLVTFRSDRSLNYAGFRANFTAFPLPTVVTPIQFKRTLRNTTVAVTGEEVKLHCQVIGGSDSVVIKWSKDGVMLKDSGLSHIIKHNKATRKSSLRLKNVMKSDEGIYGCWASHSGQNISMFGSLQVKVPAVVTDGPLSISLYARDTVDLTCKTSGDPLPRINWLVNGKNKTSLASQNNLTSTLHLTATVDAIVNCTAYNDYGQDWKSGKIKVLDGKCGRINLSGRSGDLTSPSYPKPYPSYSQCSWLIKVPAGQYIKLQFLHFVLENRFGCGSDVLKAFDGPDTSATLLGKYCGPRTDFFNIISTSNTMLVTFRSDRSLNYAGFRANFTAFPLPTVVTPIQFKRTLRNTTVAVTGEEVKLHCQVIGGSDSVVIKWSKDGVMLKDSGLSHIIKHNKATRKSSLRLKNVMKSDEGIYGCWASHSGQNISMFGSLQVNAPPSTSAPVSEDVMTFVNIPWPPPNIYKPPLNTTAELGDNVTLTCAAEGNPKPTIRWLVNGDYYENLPRDKNGTSYFTFTLNKQRTSVRCEAQNPYGIDSRTAYITAPTGDQLLNSPY